MPTVLVVITGLGWLLSLAGQQLTLEQDLTFLLRQHLIGESVEVSDGLTLAYFNKGRLSCAILTKPGLVTLRSEQCGIALS